MKKSNIVIIVCGVILVIFCSLFLYFDNQELKSIKSEKELNSFYTNRSYSKPPLFEQLLTIPFSVIMRPYDVVYNDYQWDDAWTNTKGDVIEDSNTVGESGITDVPVEKDHSTTNVQVDGVDEADIIKTDGNYIYSISGQNIIITSTKDPKNLKIESKTDIGDFPEEMIIYKNKLVVISSKSINGNNSFYSYYNSSRNLDTVITIFDIKNKKYPKVIKSIQLGESYFTSRCIDNKLYIFSNGYLRVDNDKKVIRDYIEDKKTKQIALNNIKYLKNQRKNAQTLIAYVDLNNISDVDVSSYLFDMSSAYISKKNIYLVDNYYRNSINPTLKDLFGLKGVFGLFNYDIDNNNSKLYKLSISDDGCKYVASTLIDGKTINQYSLDEYNNHIRVALDTGDGSKISIFDEKLNLIGETDSVASNEKMYSSRFIGNKAYFVTYRTMDPLFAVDLSNEKHPKVLGELKIPGYSTYLHPYDENTLIGIGMDSEEEVVRDSNGRVMDTWSYITGMKMSLFDISDINNPKEIDSIKIGDSRTSSAILTNPKALLFSKDKNLLAIPVNNYNSDFRVKVSNSDIDDAIDSYKNKSSNYISEGYIVYDINKKGFKQKGIITHEKNNTNYKYYYYNYSKLLRGVYIEDDLYTVSEDHIKVNALKDLEEISSLDINKKGDSKNG